jgi:hypothetical protein
VSLAPLSGWQRRALEHVARIVRQATTTPVATAIAPETGLATFTAGPFAATCTWRGKLRWQAPPPLPLVAPRGGQPT